MATVDLHNSCPGKNTYVIRFCSGDAFFFVLDECYVVESIIGKGFYGHVLLGQDIYKDPAHPVSIKVIYDIFWNSLITKRLLREVRIIRQVNHHFIIRIINIMEPLRGREVWQSCHCFGQNEYRFVSFTICNNIKSSDDDEETKKEKEKKNDEWKLILNQLLHGLQYLHSANILH